MTNPQNVVFSLGTQLHATITLNTVFSNKYNLLGPEKCLTCWKRFFNYFYYSLPFLHRISRGAQLRQTRSSIKTWGCHKVFLYKSGFLVSSIGTLLKYNICFFSPLDEICTCLNVMDVFSLLFWWAKEMFLSPEKCFSSLASKFTTVREP